MKGRKNWSPDASIPEQTMPVYRFARPNACELTFDPDLSACPADTFIGYRYTEKIMRKGSRRKWKL